MAKSFFTTQQQDAIVNAIRHAETKTNGEIRVHIEAKCNGNAYNRAVQVFEQLGMTNTEAKNGVLFYLAYADHQFSVIGDTGIHAKVTDAFWQDLKNLMEIKFKEHLFLEGLCQAISMAGEKLSIYFPKTTNNTNELTDDISFGA